MKHILKISHGEWGYLTNLRDWSGGKAGKAGQTPDGKHTLRQGFGDQLMPGECDIKRSDTLTSGYGYVRPWDTEGLPADEVELQQAWQSHRRGKRDYYVALRNGSPDPAAVQLYYPDRVFVTGRDELGNTLHRSQLIPHLREVGIPSGPDFWDPVQIFHGISSGFPMFEAGLRADTDLGVSWFRVKTDLSKELNNGYVWEYGNGANYGTLYAEVEDAPTFNHAFDFAYEVITDKENPRDVTPGELRAALLERATRISDEEIMEACDCFDTMEVGV